MAKQVGFITRGNRYAKIARTERSREIERFYPAYRCCDLDGRPLGGNFYWLLLQSTDKHKNAWPWTKWINERYRYRKLCDCAYSAVKCAVLDFFASEHDDAMGRLHIADTDYLVDITVVSKSPLQNDEGTEHVFDMKVVKCDGSLDDEE